ncbi:MAG: glucose-6-phosphate dehydrogenase [Sedimentisphaerales bacterium]|nr:glucose-6-phosphate dehydrogenase [Sedimentisphaerales bacterium]
MADLLNKPAQTNPSSRSAPEPFFLVIFGASGDLTRRKLIPAVYNLYQQGLLPKIFFVIAFARRDNSDENFRLQMHQAIQQFSPVASDNLKSWEQFAPHLIYHQANFEDMEGFGALKEKIHHLAARHNIAENCLFYLATQPRYFPVIVQSLADTDLARPTQPCACWQRLVVEKPFGSDLQSSRQLTLQIQKTFSEKQIFRIDHYLGKESVQNLLVFRFANSIFEPLWNNNYIDHVQISVTESIGVESRGAYYEQAGALRDILQNHIMHLLSLIAMEPPVRLDADAIRDEKVKIIRALRPIPPQCVGNDVVRAQYSADASGNQPVPGYLEEPGVAADSVTETFFALKAFIDNWRWAGVPFYIRSGKRMPVRITEIGIHFKPVPNVLFNTGKIAPMLPNMLTIRIQPNEGISLQFQVKTPGPEMRIQPFKMDFGYSDSLGATPPDAYQRLLLDALLGDSTLFARSDEVEAAWNFVDPIIAGCNDIALQKLPQYPAGSWGPKLADNLIIADNRMWTLTRRTNPR